MTTFLAWVGGTVAVVGLAAAAAFGWFYWATSGFTKWE